MLKEQIALSHAFETVRHTQTLAFGHAGSEKAWQGNPAAITASAATYICI
jgi:hypothetical protein